MTIIDKVLLWALQYSLKDMLLMYFYHDFSLKSKNLEPFINLFTKMSIYDILPTIAEVIDKIIGGTNE